jgi:tRNA A-37 threonylcarbamoyl transferase component Bud32
MAQDQQQHDGPERFQGTVTGKDLLDLLKMLHRTCASGVLHLDAGANRASLCLDAGAMRAAFFNDLAGHAALSRVFCIGRADFRFELGTAHTVAAYAHNVFKDTAVVLATVEAMLAEEMPVAPPAAGRMAALEPTPSRGQPVVPAPAAGEVTPPPSPLPHLVPPATGSGSGSRAQLAVLGDGDLAPSEAAEPLPNTQRIDGFIPPEPGMAVGKCELTAEIGRGASSVVYRARHRTLGLDVVVKVLMQGSADADQHRALSLHEARLLARLNHPNILRVFDLAENGVYPHLVMELADGPSLARLIRERRTLDAETALTLIGQVVEALGYAHATLGVVHGDIKPENILLTADHQVKLADFGIAKSALPAPEIDALFSNGTIAGTPSYIAPEQIRGGRLANDHRSDIWSLGATFYHALTGRPPYVDEDPMQLIVRRLSEAPIPPHLVNPKVERRLSQLVMSMLVRDPAARIQTYDELLELLGDVLDYTVVAGDRQRAETSDDNKVIRRRSSFWNYVPNRLFRRTSSNGGSQAAAG